MPAKVDLDMESVEYARMHALETEYWWFAGRRAIIGQLLQATLNGITPPPAAITPQLLGEHDSAPAHHLLDIGSGTGANLSLLRDVVGAAGTVTAIDFSPLALRFAADHAALPGVALLQGDALRLPFPDDQFDVITMLDVLEHLSDDSRALSEVFRVLKPGGHLVFSVPAYQHLWSAHDTALHHFRRYEYHGLQQLLRRNQFRVVRLSFAMSLMPPVAWLWRKLILPWQPRRPRQAQRHSEGAVLPSVAPFFNAALVNYLKWEGRVIVKRRLSFGTSLVGVAQKGPSSLTWAP
jgi:SAM-dependent methyltransferase